MGKALILGGATGLLGQALCKCLSAGGWEVETLGRRDGDILDIDFLREKLEKAQADAIFNTIAWTQVDEAEDHEDEASLLNRCLPDALSRILGSMDRGHLVHYSTDFVFSGPHQGGWKETDTPDPINVYGATKLEGENAVLRNLPDRSCILRTAWLFGPGRKNFVDTILGAAQHKDMLTVVDDQVGSPTYTMDLAQWSMELAARRANGVWHAVNSGHASWCELASEAVHLASLQCRIAPISSANWPQKAKRPANSTLDNSKLAEFLGKKPSPWPQALRDYIFGERMKGA